MVSVWFFLLPFIDNEFGIGQVTRSAEGDKKSIKNQIRENVVPWVFPKPRDVLVSQNKS